MVRLVCSDNVKCASNIDEDDLEYVMTMYGFDPDKSEYVSKVKSAKGNVTISVCKKSADAVIRVIKGILAHKYIVHSISELISRLDQLMNLYDADVFACMAITNTSNRKQVVQAAISTRDLSRNMVRVKSSNVWSYTINIKDRKSGVGDVVVQFKGNKGGPGDIYLYYDVPVRVWRQWLSAPSKGHFFWVNIRNTYMYRKLTGNKRGVLKNAVN